MGIGNLGLTEMLVIGIVVLILFGPSRMPEIARSLGHAMREFRRSLNQIQRELEDADPRRMIKDPLGLDRAETEETEGRDRGEAGHVRERAATSGEANEPSAAEAKDPPPPDANDPPTDPAATPDSTELKEGQGEG